MMRTTTVRTRALVSFAALSVVAATFALSTLSSGASSTARRRPAAGSASLLRVSVPSPPGRPVAVAGNGSVTLRWTAPAHANGSPIYAYMVWPYTGGHKGKARQYVSTKTKAVVTGLTNGRKYAFRVAARNRIGIGPQSATSAPVLVRAVTPGRWRPSSSVPLTWNWQLQGNVPTNTGVKVFDIDGFDNSAATVAALHAHGTKVICYIDFGTSENFRSDFGKFPASVEGATNGWPGEKWLDIRRLSVLEPIMIARMRMCVQKHFDALEPDNIDGYSNDTGFPLTAQQQLTYNTWIANTAHSLGLSVGLKNDNDQTSTLEPYFDWALDEQCNQYSECGTESVFVRANKAVFNAEYQGGTGFCPSDNADHINGVLFSLDLDGSNYQPCKGTW
jgi:hypothetical protein